jgi:hypothetical protein
LARAPRSAQPEAAMCDPREVALCMKIGSRDVPFKGHAQLVAALEGPSIALRCRPQWLESPQHRERHQGRHAEHERGL